MRTPAHSKILPAKFLAGAAVAFAATGGVALAAVSGALPARVHDSAHGALAASASDIATGASDGSTDSSSDDPADPTDSSSDDPADPTDSADQTTSSSHTPSPSLTGLCKAYQAGATTNSGKALTNPAFTVLVTAAGGPDGISAYCITLVGPPATHHAGAPPTDATRVAKTHSSGAPTTHPGAPTTHPGAPSTHRAGPAATQRHSP